ncbi:MAG: cell division protein FtsQ/DivIB [Betaproteobacteria bacterium]|nr:cell division protein FtsQ/DivIB [Betaproteobacteria bacterium]MCL2886379.1 cell division protein FtsQ/DivIB [Betaproteobacteria bacterium]
MWHKAHLLNALADLLLLAGTAVLLAAGAVWLARVPAWPVARVDFAEALVNTRRAEVEQVLQPALKGNFFSVNLDTARTALERLPWVRKAEVRRVWPARLLVRVEEHRAAARWGEGRGELVNSYGEVFVALSSAERLAALPLLHGPAGTAPEVLARYADLVGRFAPLGERPAQLLLTPRLAWQLKLASGMALNLGREQPKAPLSARLQRFIAVWPQTIGKLAARPEKVDLRYPNGFAMRLAGEGKGN